MIRRRTDRSGIVTADAVSVMAVSHGGPGMTRTDFWTYFDALQRAAIAAEGVEGALLDLNKYDFR